MSTSQPSPRCSASQKAISGAWNLDTSPLVRSSPCEFKSRAALLLLGLSVVFPARRLMTWEIHIPAQPTSVGARHWRARTDPCRNEGVCRDCLGHRSMRSSLAAARTQDERIFHYRLNNVLAQAAADFGKNEQVERESETAALALKSLRDLFRERLDLKTGKPSKGKYVVPEYQECREAFLTMLKKLRKKARKPLAYGMPPAGPGILPILEIVAVLVGIEKPWWLKEHESEDD